MSDTPPRKMTHPTLSLKRDTVAAPRIKERLHKVLAQAGLGSRRALEQRISDGLVKVNGEIAVTGMTIQSGDRIEMDTRTYVASALNEPTRVLLYNKPEGEITTRDDPEGRPTVFDALPSLNGARWISIGRLDINTSGLLPLTTDGELANAMMHPSFEVEREYLARIRAPEGHDEVSDQLVDRLIRGVALDDGPAQFMEVERIGRSDSHHWFRVVVKEGRHREVRRLWESQGCQVSRLKRIRFGRMSLPREVLRGHYIELPQIQVSQLRADLKLDDSPPSALTLQPVIGQRRAARATVLVNQTSSHHAYINGQSIADEGRELRRFDTLRDDGNRQRRGKKSFAKEGLTVSGEDAAQQARKPFKQRNSKRGGQQAALDSNPAAFRSWYVPDGVTTGPGPSRPNRTRTANKANKAGQAAPRNAHPAAGRGPGKQARNRVQQPNPGRKNYPYGHPANAPVFPSDHATPDTDMTPYGSLRSPSGKPTPGRRSPFMRKRGPR